MKGISASSGRRPAINERSVTAFSSAPSRERPFPSPSAVYTNGNEKIVVYVSLAC